MSLHIVSHAGQKILVSVISQQNVTDKRPLVEKFTLDVLKNSRESMRYDSLVEFTQSLYDACRGSELESTFYDEFLLPIIHKWVRSAPHPDDYTIVQSDGFLYQHNISGIVKKMYQAAYGNFSCHTNTAEKHDRSSDDLVKRLAVFIVEHFDYEAPKWTFCS